jgi:hypothetical protein
MDKLYFMVDEGMFNPIDKNEISWRHYKVYETKEEAIQTAKEMFLSRVSKCEIIWEGQRGKRIKVTSKEGMI